MSDYNFQNKNIVFFCLKIFFTFTNSVDPDEMQHYAAFHLGLHCLQKYSGSVVCHVTIEADLGHAWPRHSKDKYSRKV